METLILLTERQRQLVSCVLDAAADALASGEWPSLPGLLPSGGSVAPLLVHLASQVSRADEITIRTAW